MQDVDVGGDEEDADGCWWERESTEEWPVDSGCSIFFALDLFSVDDAGTLTVPEFLFSLICDDTLIQEQTRRKSLEGGPLLFAWMPLAMVDRLIISGPSRTRRRRESQRKDGRMWYRKPCCRGKLEKTMSEVF